jgi:predicted alpha/beta superfamily hydrolase
MKRRSDTMRTIRLLGAMVALSFASLLGAPELTHAAAHARDGEPVTIGERYQIESSILKETRRYIVHKPPRYDFSNDSYPVVILLDGTANIQNVSASMDFLADNGRAMPMIVVGIENTDRQRDLTPPLTGAKPENFPAGNIGGATKFLSFIADELIPHLDRNYRTRPTRILIGHSYGGLFAIHALFNRPELFTAYIVISPSLWWDDQALAKQADTFVASHADLQAAVFMTMGNEGGNMLGGAQKVIGSLAGSRGISTEFRRWPQESHGSVVMPSVYEGMEWLHELYYIHEPFRTYEESGLEFFDKRFAAISKFLGYEVKVPERVLMNVQFELREWKRPVEAQKVLQRVLQLYPHSPGAHYELGKAFLDSNERSRAEEELKRALELYPGYVGARAELEKLGLDPKTVVPEAKPPPAVLRSYVGEYRYADEVSRVTLEDGKLFIGIRDEPKRELRAMSNVDFYSMDADREYTFQKKSGRTTAMKVRAWDFVYDSVKLK